MPGRKSQRGGAAPGRAAALAAFTAAGLFAGVLATAITGKTSRLDAGGYAAALDLREAPDFAPNAGGRDRGAVIETIIGADKSAGISAGAPERLEARRGRKPPRIVIVIDDVGPDRGAFEALMELPGPMTLSFLPYADDVQRMANRAIARGHDILLHLPMEPSGRADPGPGALKSSMEAGELFAALGDNLARFEGYSGVNNHMGSKLTRDEQAMKRVLAFLDNRGLYFLDSLTTGDSKARIAGEAVGAEVIVRDVFLDADPGEEAVRRQLAVAERIAAETGYVIAIAHPRAETLAVIGPWLTSAPARGFRLVTMTSMRGERSGAYASNEAGERLR